MLKERRELNIEPAFELGSTMNDRPEEEQLANYLLDLEAKLKKGQIIDFVRAVSPVIYRLFMRLVEEKIPDIRSYILDNKDDRYDVWLRDELATSKHSFLKTFKPERHVTSNSLSQLILGLDFKAEIKDSVSQLRQLERSVRNPLAHLIKAFDEEELRSTTNFSSQAFLASLIALAKLTGIHYDTTFYFDRLNKQVLEIL